MAVTSILKRIQPQQHHLKVLVVLMLLTFGMTLSLAWAAWSAARDARQQAEDTMRGWAGMAAEGLKANTEIAFGNGVPQALVPFLRGGADAYAPMDQVAASIVPGAMCGCLGDPQTIEFFFRVNLETAQVEIHGSDPDPAFRTWLLTRVQSAPVAIFAADSSGVGVAVGKVASRIRFAPYARLPGRNGQPPVAIGFSASADAFGDVMNAVWMMGRLLPQAPQLSNDSLLYAMVHDAAGVRLFETPTPYDTRYKAERRLSEPVAGLTVTIAVRPDASNALIVGGIPEPPIGRLAGLLTVTTLLLLSALYLIRRESDLARLRADFIAGVSHELRTPLAQIRMFAETLLLGRVRSEAERTRSLEIIDQEARRLVHLVENVLIFAKAERRKSRINPQLTDLPADIREAVQGFAVLSRSRDVDIRVELQENVAAPVDRGALRQVLLNLLDNAVKYGPLQQRITVGLALYDDDARIWVDDEGPGVPADERDRVFSRFFRLARDVDSPVGGSGIGLAIVRELVALHGGRVWIDDAPGGRGARVVAEFPGAYVRPDAATGGWAVA